MTDKIDIKAISASIIEKLLNEATNLINAELWQPLEDVKPTDEIISDAFNIHVNIGMKLLIVLLQTFAHFYPPTEVDKLMNSLQGAWEFYSKLLEDQLHDDIQKSKTNH